MKRTVLSLIVAHLLGGAALAAPLPPALQAARPAAMLPADMSRFEFRDGINSKDAPGSATVVGQRDGAPVVRLVNPKGASNYGGINVNWRTAKPIRKGDVLYGRFTLRTLSARQESGEAEGMFYLAKERGERNAQAFSIGQEWTTVGFPFVAREDIAAGEGVVGFNFGNLEQTFEVTGIELHNFEDRVQLADLPVTRFTYAGREADAPWRQAALARIEHVRTAPLTVKVVDGAGRPVSGARVEAVLERPAFLWGSSVSSERLVGKDADAERYRQEVARLFDTTVIENGFKWPRWRSPEYRARALASLDWLRAQGKRVKGHTLAWTGWKFSPQDIADDPAQRARIAPLVEDHIRELTAATHGKLIGWDVVNEAVHESDYYQYMPRERLAEWFKLAEKSDPAMELTLNEYSMLNRSSSPLFIAEFKDFAAMLRRHGARIDVLGVQGHVGQTPRSPAGVLSDLDLLAEGGNKVQITEFDFNTPDEQLQGDYTRDFLIAVYSHPAVTGFIQWGFWQGEHWKPDAAMYRRDWSAKPNLRVWEDLVLKQWKTRAAGQTDSAGAYSARGHHGRYRVSATVGGRTVSGAADLAAQGQTVVLTLK